MRKLFFALITLLSVSASAATLVCDWMPFSPDGSDINKADSVQYSSDGGETWNDFNLEASGDNSTFRISEPFDTTQSVDWTVRAYNSVWARESAHVPFTWGGEGPIPAPMGIRVIP